MNEYMLTLMKVELAVRALESGLLDIRHTMDDMYLALGDADGPWFTELLARLKRQTKDFKMDEGDLSIACGETDE